MNEARTSLSENGFRLVLLPMDMLEHTGYRLDEIEARLGPVENDQGLLIWDLGPSETPSQCVTMEARTNGLSRSATSPVGG